MAGNTAVYATGTANNTKEGEEEENEEGNHKQPVTNPIRGSHGRAKESAARSRLQRSENLDRYATGMANDPEEDEETENLAGNAKQLVRNPVGGSNGWETENSPTLAPSTLGIPGGAAGRFTKQATTLPSEVNTTSAGTKAKELHRVLMGGNPMLQNKVGGGNRMRRVTGTTSAQQKCVGRVRTG